MWIKTKKLHKMVSIGYNRSIYVYFYLTNEIKFFLLISAIQKSQHWALFRQNPHLRAEQIRGGYINSSFYNTEFNLMQCHHLPISRRSCARRNSTNVSLLVGIVMHLFNVQDCNSHKSA